jgi:myo-inositol 2-dehydrogenase/D-chiro-inositol 1-dehydrogenase
MGARHAVNFLQRTPRCDLVAAFSPDPAEIAWAQKNLEPYGVTLYSDYDEMLQHPGLEAMVVSTATIVHAEFSIRAMQKGLHVLCEKPLGTTVEIVSLLYDKVQRNKRNETNHCAPDSPKALSRPLIKCPTLK